MGFRIEKGLRYGIVPLSGARFLKREADASTNTQVIADSEASEAEHRLPIDRRLTPFKPFSLFDVQDTPDLPPFFSCSKPPFL